MEHKGGRGFMGANSSLKNYFFIVWLYTEMPQLYCNYEVFIFYFWTLLLWFIYYTTVYCVLSCNNKKNIKIFKVIGICV